MRLTRAVRSGAVGALVTAAFGTSVLFTPASASADSEWECHGTAVKRCATVWWDQSAGTYKARAKITDVAGGGSYQVKVTDVTLQRFDGTRWVTVRHADDHDGWHGTEDLAGTSTVEPCATWPNQSYGVVATFNWRGASSGQETWRPNTGWSLMCD